MYQLANNQEWDTDFFHSLMSDKRIISSKEAKLIREQLANAGALPHLDNNYDWAMLCISYCFTKELAYKPKELTSAPNAHGTEIPSFTTCFQNYSRLWLVILSDALFRQQPEKAINKDDLYKFIADLWHTGALKLEEEWQRCQQYHQNDDLAARQQFLNNLAELAIQNAGISPISSSLKTNLSPEMLDNECSEIKTALDKTVGKGGTIAPEYSGVRYDCFRVQFDRFVDLERYHTQICSELGLGDDALRCERIVGPANTWHIKILRKEDTWLKFGETEFQAALSQYQAQKQAFRLPVLIGIDEQSQPIFADLTKAVHSFVAGKTGSGKSVFVHSLLHSLLKLNPAEHVEVVIIDPKKTEYHDFVSQYPNIYGEKVITDMNEIAQTLNELVNEVEKRNDLLRTQAKRNIAELPDDAISPRYIVVVVDEVANLFSRNKSAEELLCQLAEKARSAGIFLLLSTQTPNAEIFSQRLRANIPTRIAFSVLNAKASEIVLGESGLGAEKLVGSGDHLVKWNGDTAQFLHGYNV